MSASFRNLATAAQVLAGIHERPNQCGSRALFQLNNLEKLDEVRDRYFHEDRSRRVFDWVMQCQAVSDFYGGLSLPVDWGDTPFPAEVWKKLEEKAEAMTSGFVDGDYILDRIDTWLLESYALKGFCEAMPGDTVLDCGTFTGNTSLYFSQKVGPDGHVYGFEASPSTFVCYTKNMRELANVTPVHAAVHNSCGTLFLAGDGDAGANVRYSSGVEVPAISLDEFFRANGLARVDFIKMDVEGAEINALEGAQEIIRTWLPKMALSAYHKMDDLISIPEYIESIAPGRYAFRLRHFSNFICETVLFCAPRTGEEDAARPEAAPADNETRHTDSLPLAQSFYLTLRNVVKGQIREESPRLHAMLLTLKKMEAEMNELLKAQERLGAENLVLRSLLEKEKRRNQGEKA